MQMMYHSSIADVGISEVLRIFWLEKEAPDAVKEFAEELFTKAFKKKNFNDELVKKYLKKGWTFERLGEIEKSVFRVGIAELFDGDAPVYAILDDYVSIASKYMDEKSASLVNGILDTIKGEFKIDRSGD